MISELAATQFSLTMYESKGVVGANESTIHLWIRFRWWFLESSVAQFSLTVSKSIGIGRANESTRHVWKLFRWQFPSRHQLSFRWPFLSQQGLRALPNIRLSFRRCLGDDFWVGSDSIFVDYLWVKRGCGCWQIHASHSESVSLMILEMAVSQFSLIVSNSIGDGRADESTPKSFVDDFPFSTDLVFVDFFWVNKGCERFWIHASPLEGV
jgi:hypothetical protein